MMTTMIRVNAVYGIVLWGALWIGLLAAMPTAVRGQQQCDPVQYHSAEPNCWGQYSAHADFTTEFTVQVNRVWQETPPEVANFRMQYSLVTRQDNGQQLLFKCGWWSDQSKLEDKCYDLEAGGIYRVRAAQGYGYVYVQQPIDGIMTWLETPCDRPDESDCSP